MLKLLFTLVIVYAIVSPYCKKKILNHMTETEYIVSVGIFFFFSLIIFYIYKKYYKKEKISIISKLKCKKHLIVLLLILTAFKYIVFDNKIKYFKNTDLSKFIPQMKSLAILTSLVVGVYIFKEKKKIKDYFGSFLILIGFVIISL